MCPLLIISFMRDEVPELGWGAQNHAVCGGARIQAPVSWWQTPTLPVIVLMPNLGLCKIENVAWNFKTSRPFIPLQKLVHGYPCFFNTLWGVCLVNYKDCMEAQIRTPKDWSLDMVVVLRWCLSVWTKGIRRVTCPLKLIVDWWLFTPLPQTLTLPRGICSWSYEWEAGPGIKWRHPQNQAPTGNFFSSRQDSVKGAEWICFCLNNFLVTFCSTEGKCQAYPLLLWQACRVVKPG